MYTNAELFLSAANAAQKESFLSNVTLSIPDAAPGCVDLDAEKARLSRLWDLAHAPISELVRSTGLSQTAFARGAGIPLRTVQNWCGGVREAPIWVRFLLAEHYGLLEVHQ